MPKLKPLLITLLTASVASIGFARTISVPVTEILPESLIEGDLYTLEPEALVKDSIATFTVKSSYGSYQATGMVSLEEHIIELEAIGKLEAMKKTDVYKDAAKNSALGPWDTAKGLVSEPITTVKESAKGFGSYVADIGYSVFSKDPSQENVAKTTLGFAAAKRKLAYQLGVNPYSRFEPLQDALGEVSWTATGGGLTVTVLFSFVKDTPGTVLRVSKTAGNARKLVRDMSPRKLAKLNEETLNELDINETSIELLLENYNYDPEARTRLVAALNGLSDAEGLQSIVDSALIAGSFRKANLVREWVELMEAFSDNVEPVTAIKFYDSNPFLVTGKGQVYGVFPADYGTSKEGTEEEFDALTSLIKADGYTPAEIYVTGVIESDLADALVKSGWTKINQKVQDDFSGQ